MSSVNENSFVYDGSAQTGYALGALFGMILFNVTLIAIALILRRITRSKKDEGGNAVELKAGSFDERTSKVYEDVENPSALQAEPTGKRKSGENGNPQSAANSGIVHHENKAFVDIDLENDDAVYDSPSTAGDPAIYTPLNSVKTEVPGDDENYENLTGERTKEAHSESNVCY